MKFTNLMIATLVLGAAGSVFAKAEVNPPATERVVSINSVLLPSGLDNSDPVAVVSGLFPNSCYSWNRADVTNPDAYTHEVRAVATVQQGMCLMVLIPYTKEVAIGKLDKGSHTLRFMNGDGTYIEKKLDVQ